MRQKKKKKSLKDVGHNPEQKGKRSNAGLGSSSCDFLRSQWDQRPDKLPVG